jgi:hypothetical protein
MIFGDISKFAVEYEVDNFCEKKGLLALGFFCIYINGFCYGLKKHNATYLACTYDEIERRIENRGLYLMPSIHVANAAAIVDAVFETHYIDSNRETVLDMPVDEFKRELRRKDIMWAPDGDAAFDDGGHVLQFDIADKVRLIGFINSYSQSERVASTAEVVIDADIFYATLREWKKNFDKRKKNSCN